MSMPLYLFSGGPAFGSEGLPKPLMKVDNGRSLLVHFLLHLVEHREVLPPVITLLCDDGQEAALAKELSDLSYPVPIKVQACGPNASTFEKLFSALKANENSRAVVQFAYPDIFSLDRSFEPNSRDVNDDTPVHISAASLTSRFPRLIVDIYSGDVKGISNYTSSVPANPLHVFGGDLWCRADKLLSLAAEFRSQVEGRAVSLEYDFFFWLINQGKVTCKLIHGERLWIDSFRDIKLLLSKTGDIL